MKKQYGFTLFELMIAMSIIVILSALGVNNYQRYLQKAAMTDLLHTLLPYKMAIEICLLEQGNLSDCQPGSSGVPPTKTNRFIKEMTIIQGVITLSGQQSLQGLNITLTPSFNHQSGEIFWDYSCTNNTNNQQSALCQDTFRSITGGK